MEVVKKSVARGLVDASSNLRVKRASEVSLRFAEEVTCFSPRDKWLREDENTFPLSHFPSQEGVTVMV
jgi:hypothetical protein